MKHPTWGRWFLSIYLGLLGAVLVSSPAHAYVDPGSGSMIFQAAIAALMAAGVGIKLSWRRIKSFFQRKKMQSHE